MGVNLEIEFKEILQAKTFSSKDTDLIDKINKSIPLLAAKEGETILLSLSIHSISCQS